MRLENNHFFSFVAAGIGWKKKVLFATRRCHLPKYLFYGIFLFLICFDTV